MTMRTRFVLLAAIAVFTSSARAQAPDAEVRAVVNRLFDGMRTGDSSVVRSVFHPAARLVTTLTRNGAPVVQIDSLEQFVRAVGTPHSPAWDERLANTTVQIDGNLASVWTDYTFYAGDRLSHCVVDAFHLVKTADGWKIIALADTRRREGCPSLK